MVSEGKTTRPARGRNRETDDDHADAERKSQSEVGVELWILLDRGGRDGAVGTRLGCRGYILADGQTGWKSARVTDAAGLVDLVRRWTHVHVQSKRVTESMRVEGCADSASEDGLLVPNEDAELDEALDEDPMSEQVHLVPVHTRNTERLRLL